MSAEYQIRISGSGTREEIAKSLRRIADRLYHPTSKGDDLNVEDIEGEWEDATVLADIEYRGGEDSGGNYETKYFRNNTFNGANLD